MNPVTRASIAGMARHGGNSALISTVRRPTMNQERLLHSVTMETPSSLVPPTTTEMAIFQATRGSIAGMARRGINSVAIWTANSQEIMPEVLSRLAATGIQSRLVLTETMGTALGLVMSVSSPGTPHFGVKLAPILKARKPTIRQARWSPSAAMVAESRLPHR